MHELLTFDLDQILILTRHHPLLSRELAQLQLLYEISSAQSPFNLQNLVWDYAISLYLDSTSGNLPVRSLPPLQQLP